MSDRRLTFSGVERGVAEEALRRRSIPFVVLDDYIKAHVQLTNRSISLEIAADERASLVLLCRGLACFRPIRAEQLSVVNTLNIFFPGKFVIATGGEAVYSYELPAPFEPSASAFAHCLDEALAIVERCSEILTLLETPSSKSGVDIPDELAWLLGSDEWSSSMGARRVIREAWQTARAAWARDVGT